MTTSRLAIFGDSWATLSPNDPHVNLYWQNILAKKLDAEVECFGKGGTSLYYSFDKLKRCNLKKYDYIVFSETSISRLYLGGREDKGLIINSLEAAEAIMRNDSLRHHWDVANAAIHYYQNLLEYDYLVDIHHLMLAEITRILTNHNVKFIIQPLINVGFKYKTMINFFLLDIKQKQYSVIPKSESLQYNTGRESCPNHLTINNNELLANYYFDLLTTGKSNIQLEDFEKFPEPFDQWFQSNK